MRRTLILLFTAAALLTQSLPALAAHDKETRKELRDSERARRKQVSEERKANKRVQDTRLKERRLAAKARAKERQERRIKHQEKGFKEFKWKQKPKFV
ncbi:MAG: hypothetical protein HY820_30645 [Acidobacteria bacterium]|nr:hypothetical protein [Acidobacteriota bacterium]